MKPSTLFLLLAVGLVILPQASQGQRIASLTRFPASTLPARSYTASHYFEGAAIGAGVVGTTGVWFGWVVCQLSETTSACAKPLVVFGLAGALLGGTTGALVGPVPCARPAPRGNAARAAMVGATAGEPWDLAITRFWSMVQPVRGCIRRFQLAVGAHRALGVTE